MLPKGFAGVDVREMDLNDRQGNGRERIAQRHARMRESGGVDQDPAEAAHGFLNPINEFAFMIRLKACDLDVEFLGAGRKVSVDLSEGLVSIDLRLTLTE
jgi:3-hydroxyacyl-CoA dehydrogenase